MFSPPILASQIVHAYGQSQSGIVPELVMVINILIPQGDPDHSLPQQSWNRMLDPRRIAVVRKTVGQAAGEVPDLIGFLEQDRSGIGGNDAAIK